VDRTRGKSVSITLKHSPILKLKDFAQKGRVEVPEGTTVRSLLERIGIHSNHHRYLLIYANGRKRGLDYGLQQNDEVQLFLPVGGG
jgi:molybdopterin converting factor small subunit